MEGKKSRGLVGCLGLGVRPKSSLLLWIYHTVFEMVFVLSPFSLSSFSSDGPPLWGELLFRILRDED